MIKLLIAGILLHISTLAYGDSVGGGVIWSDDSDGNTTTRVSANALYKSKYGVSVTDITINTPVVSGRGNSVEAVINDSYGIVSLNGTAGIGQVNNNQFFVGDMTANVAVTKRVLLSGSVYGDIVDSTNGIINNVSFRGVLAGGEYTGDSWGVSGNYRLTEYSNNNNATGIFGKLYYNVANGIAVFGTVKHTDHSLPNNGDFWSPQKYERNGLGVSARYRYENLLGYASFDHGQAKIINGGVTDTQTSTIIKLGGSVKISKALVGIQATNESDHIPNSDNYNFISIAATVSYSLD